MFYDNKHKQFICEAAQVCEEIVNEIKTCFGPTGTQIKLLQHNKGCCASKLMKAFVPILYMGQSNTGGAYKKKSCKIIFQF